MENIIIPLSISEITEDIFDQIIEEVEKKIPDEIKNKVMSPAMRRQLFEKHGEKAFLFPEKMKFPVIDPNTGNYDCRLLYAAYLRANQHKKSFPEYNEVVQKAKELFKINNCFNSVGIKIEGESVIDIESFIYLFEEK
jgi:hypothetical protein